MGQEQIIIFVDEDTITPEELAEGDAYESSNEGLQEKFSGLFH